jgi:hypothetical protein
MLPSAVIPYDRTDRFAMSPFPDDLWLEPDASTPTGYRVALSLPSGEADVVILYSALMNETSKLDGFSPIGGIVIKLSAAPDTASLPLTPQASLEPSATLRLFDVTPGSDTLGRRIPFQLSPISRMLEGQEIDHSLVLYPSIPLTPEGRYAVLVTTDGRTEDGRRFGPSPSMASVLGVEQPGEAPEITKARNLLADGVLDVLADESAVSPPVRPSDVALVFRSRFCLDLRRATRSTASAPGPATFPWSSEAHGRRRIGARASTSFRGIRRPIQESLAVSPCHSCLRCPGLRKAAPCLFSCSSMAVRAVQKT